MTPLGGEESNRSALLGEPAEMMVPRGGRDQAARKCKAKPMMSFMFQRGVHDPPP